jgi:hypothetical protein
MQIKGSMVEDTRNLPDQIGIKLQELFREEPEEQLVQEIFPKEFEKYRSFLNEKKY